MSFIYCLTGLLYCHLTGALAISNTTTAAGYLVLLSRSSWLVAVKTALTILLCLVFTSIYSQPALHPTPTKLRPLHIGDRVPDIVLNNLYNHSTTSTNLASFRGKLLLLDFWATYCTTCIEKMDHMEQLVKQHPDQLAVLLVSTAGKNDTRRRINDLFGRIKNSAGNRYQLPVVVNDTALSGLFPNKYLPHIVWINADQKVIAITGSEAVTTHNIRAALKGNVPERIERRSPGF